MNRAGLAFLLCFVPSAFAAPCLGVDMFLRVWANGNSDFEFKLLPSLILMPTRSLEVVPKAGIGVNDPDLYGADFSLYAGCGLFFHVIDRGPFVFSLGPEVLVPLGFGDNLVASGFDIALPLNTDLVLADGFFARLSIRAVGLDFSVVSRDTPGGGRTDHSVEFTIDTVLQPYLGFYFCF